MQETQNKTNYFRAYTSMNEPELYGFNLKLNESYRIRRVVEVNLRLTEEIRTQLDRRASMHRVNGWRAHDGGANFRAYFLQ